MIFAAKGSAWRKGERQPVTRPAILKRSICMHNPRLFSAPWTDCSYLLNLINSMNIHQLLWRISISIISVQSVFSLWRKIRTEVLFASESEGLCFAAPSRLLRFAAFKALGHLSHSNLKKNTKNQNMANRVPESHGERWTKWPAPAPAPSSLLVMTEPISTSAIHELGRHMYPTRPTHAAPGTNKSHVSFCILLGSWTTWTPWADSVPTRAAAPLFWQSRG